jgi:hypothetical protein
VAERVPPRRERGDEAPAAERAAPEVGPGLSLVPSN